MYRMGNWDGGRGYRGWGGVKVGGDIRYVEV